MGVSLLLIAAFFQLFDGIQTVTTGALRGISNTASAMVLNFLCYWMFGLPLGWYLCFHRHMGARGVWVGLCLALIVLAGALLLVWRKKSQQLVLPVPTHEVAML
jgi:MATE family multidrug resistance protein